MTDPSEFEVNGLEQNLGTQAFSCDTLSVTEKRSKPLDSGVDVKTLAG